MKDEITSTIMTQTFSEVVATSNLKKGLRERNKIFDDYFCLMIPDERHVLITEFDIIYMIMIG